MIVSLNRILLVSAIFIQLLYVDAQNYIFWRPRYEYGTVVYTNIDGEQYSGTLGQLNEYQEYELLTWGPINNEKDARKMYIKIALNDLEVNHDVDFDPADVKTDYEIVQKLIEYPNIRTTFSEYCENAVIFKKGEHENGRKATIHLWRW